ncbi:MAG: DUF1491 family protein [Sphingomonadaceae bacterium]|nr:DUF1491 family protein [Sphingomonadaceae bacterium]
MTPRLVSSLVVNALIRRVGAAGGIGTVVAKGDATAGALLLSCCERGVTRRLIERVLDLAGVYRWADVGPDLPNQEAVVSDYLTRRRRSDPDLWILELDIAGVERFAAEIVAEG